MSPLSGNPSRNCGTCLRRRHAVARAPFHRATASSSDAGVSLFGLRICGGGDLDCCVAYCTIWGLDDLLRRTRIDNLSQCEFMISDLPYEILNDSANSDNEDDDLEPFCRYCVVERRSVLDMTNLRDIGPVIHSSRTLKLRLNLAKDLPALLQPAPDSLCSLDAEISELEDTETDHNLRSL
ncbi:uncharacterized protein SCHCODRAFT_01096381 [Schizophyllum commune H4-8]|nr:uncharacterized protein SCHCODRAFT_01096381 [Schizophyllum commune H4-8]KAI5890938.1 hypothetical protein SCHCODRAFT_01096381 [Schizophyllum commune H4-8]